jgi:hypothetical protein
MTGIGDAIASAFVALAVIGLAVGLTLGIGGMWLWQHVGVTWPFYLK